MLATCRDRLLLHMAQVFRRGDKYGQEAAGVTFVLSLIPALASAGPHHVVVLWSRRQPLGLRQRHSSLPGRVSSRALCAASVECSRRGGTARGQPGDRTCASRMLGGTDYAVVGAATGAVDLLQSPLVITHNSAAIPYSNRRCGTRACSNQVLEILQTGPIADPVGSGCSSCGAAKTTWPSIAASAGNAVGNLASIIGALYLDGARRFLVPNCPTFRWRHAPRLAIGSTTGLAAADDRLQ